MPGGIFSTTDCPKNDGNDLHFAVPVRTVRQINPEVSREEAGSSQPTAMKAVIEYIPVNITGGR